MDTEVIVFVFIIILVIGVLGLLIYKSRTNIKNKEKTFVFNLNSEQENYYNSLIKLKFIKAIKDAGHLGDDEEEELKKFIFQDGGKKYFDKCLEIVKNVLGPQQHFMQVMSDITNEWIIYRENKYKPNSKADRYYNYKGDYSQSYLKDLANLKS